MAKTKSQAALEFLTTYSWAFFTLIITIGALYYFGIFDFDKFLPEKCQFTTQLECLDFTMDYDTNPADSIIRIKLVNNLGEPINVDDADNVRLSITNDANPPLDCTTPTAVTGWEPGIANDFEFTGCSGGGFIEDERVEAKVTLQYYSPLTNPGNEPRHIVNGKILGRVK